MSDLIIIGNGVNASIKQVLAAPSFTNASNFLFSISISIWCNLSRVGGVKFISAVCKQTREARGGVPERQKKAEGASHQLIATARQKSWYGGVKGYKSSNGFSSVGCLAFKTLPGHQNASPPGKHWFFFPIHCFIICSFV